MATPVGAYTPSGAMCHEVTFYQKGARNDDGTYPNDVPFIGPVWAAFRVLQGRELDKAQEVVQEVEVIITVAFIEGLDQSMTVRRWDGESYLIHYISDPDGRQVEQRCYCSLIGQAEQ
jgi:SPP1 family predicted phage head-tail adaptor